MIPNFNIYFFFLSLWVEGQKRLLRTDRSFYELDQSFFPNRTRKKITFCFPFTKIPVQLVKDTGPVSKNTGLVLINKKNGIVRKKTGPVSKKPGTQYVICHIFAPLVICQRVGIAHTR